MGNHVRGTIKPLVWNKYLTKEIWICDTNLGTYTVYGNRSHSLSWEFDAFIDLTTHDADTIDTAKAAAQADYEARIAAQIQPDAEPIGWQTIETAPRDGSPFLAYGGSYVYECWFVNDPYDGSYLQDHADSEPNPTHWMPRPADPQPALSDTDSPQASEAGDAGELADAISEMRGLVQCRCHESYLNRGLHDPSCNYGAAGSVETIIRALTEDTP